MDHIREDNAIASGYAVVTNIAGGASETSSGYHSFAAGHYIAAGELSACAGAEAA